jgi:hypothetical protein
LLHDYIMTITSHYFKCSGSMMEELWGELGA